MRLSVLLALVLLLFQTKACFIVSSLAFFALLRNKLFLFTFNLVKTRLRISCFYRQLLELNA